jgi:hypothetical protein
MMYLEPAGTFAFDISLNVLCSRQRNADLPDNL